jgi:hypothetical protein
MLGKLNMECFGKFHMNEEHVKEKLPDFKFPN